MVGGEACLHEVHRGLPHVLQLHALEGEDDAPVLQFLHGVAEEFEGLHLGDRFSLGIYF